MARHDPQPKASSHNRMRLGRMRSNRMKKADHTAAVGAAKRAQVLTVAQSKPGITEPSSSVLSADSIDQTRQMHST